MPYNVVALNTQFDIFDQNGEALKIQTEKINESKLSLLKKVTRRTTF